MDDVRHGLRRSRSIGGQPRLENGLAPSTGSFGRVVLRQAFGHALPYGLAHCGIVDAGEQLRGFADDQRGRFIEIIIDQRLLQFLAQLQDVERVVIEADLAADETAFTAELEQTRLVAILARLECDSRQVMAIVEACGDKEQGFKIGIAVEAVMLDQVG